MNFTFYYVTDAGKLIESNSSWKAFKTPLDAWEDFKVRVHNRFKDNNLDINRLRVENNKLIEQWQFARAELKKFGVK